MYMMDGPPFRLSKSSPHTVHDRRGAANSLTRGSLHCLERLTSRAWRGVQIAVVSRTNYPEWADECLNLLQYRCGSSGELRRLRDAISHFQIYPGDKKTHFKRIQRDSGIDFDRMVFFDNEMRNVRSVAALGVHSFHTPYAQTVDAWHDMLAHFGIDDADADADDDKASGDESENSSSGNNDSDGDQK